jgi:hypothetical protein
LGAFEIGLGLVLLLWREELGLLFYAMVTMWAFIAAFVLLRQALRQRARLAASPEESSAAGESPSST